MNIFNIIRAIKNIPRGTGHTTACLEGVKNTPNAKLIRSLYPSAGEQYETVSLSQLEQDTFGNRSPYVFDVSTVAVIIQCFEHQLELCKNQKCNICANRLRCLTDKE